MIGEAINLLAGLTKLVTNPYIPYFFLTHKNAVSHKNEMEKYSTWMVMVLVLVIVLHINDGVGYGVGGGTGGGGAVLRMLLQHWRVPSFQA